MLHFTFSFGPVQINKVCKTGDQKSFSSTVTEMMEKKITQLYYIFG